MAITPPTRPTPPTPPKISIGEAAHEAQANTTHTTGDAQAEQQARDSVARGNGALSKTTTGTPRDRTGQEERPNAAARTDAAKGDAVNTSASKVDRGTQTEGRTGADVANGLDMAQENAALRQQLAGTEQKQPQVPASYTATSALYWAGMIALALVLGLFFFRRFLQKKSAQARAEGPSLGERILACEKNAPARNAPASTQTMGAHDDLLAAAERTRRARDTRGEILPEYTGLTAGEALERLMEEEQVARAQMRGQDAPADVRHAAHPKPAAVQKSAPTTAKTSPTQEDAEEMPRFEVRV